MLICANKTTVIVVWHIWLSRRKSSFSVLYRAGASKGNRKIPTLQHRGKENKKDMTKTANASETVQTHTTHDVCYVNTLHVG